MNFPFAQGYALQNVNKVALFKENVLMS